MYKVLICGADGMLGQELMRVFHNTDTIGLTRTDLDLTDHEATAYTITKNAPDIVLNASAYNNVDGSESEEGKKMAYAVNADAVGNCATLCAQQRIPFVHFSTDYVFEGRTPEGYNETALPCPINTYGKSKLRGEQFIQEQMRAFYIIRLSRLFGKPGTSEEGKKSFVDLMLTLGRTRPELKVIDDQWSKPTYAPDLAHSVYALIHNKAPYGIYHLPNEDACTWYTFAKEIFSHAHITTPLIPVPTSAFPRPATIPSHTLLQNTKQPLLRSWKQALHEYLETVQ